MDKSENLELPYIMPNQAQKHVTHNEAIRYLDALVQISITSRELTEPPNAPESGSRYIVANNAAGAWANKSNQIAAYQDNAWVFYQPNSGWIAWLTDENTIVVFQEGNWQTIQSGSGNADQIDFLGINTSANAGSRFGVSSNNSFFTHEGDSHRLSINKSESADTGSLIFNTNWIGHAEMGLAGDNNFSIKVTSDGVNWSDSLIVDADTGKVRFPSGYENSELSGVPDNLSELDIIYLDQASGSDENDGKSATQAIKSLQRLKDIFSVGRRLQVRLLSDVIWDYAIRLNYPIAMLEIVGRRIDNSGYENRTITVRDSTNTSNLPGCLQMNCISSVYLRGIDLILDTSKGQSFLNFATTMGYLRTLSVNLSRIGTGTCCLYADGSSFVAARHQAMSIDATAKGYVAQGVSAGENPNDDWRYVSNLNSF